MGKLANKIVSHIKFHENDRERDEKKFINNIVVLRINHVSLSIKLDEDDFEYLY